MKMERLSILKKEHTNCVNPSCHACDGLKYFNNKEYSPSVLSFKKANEFDIVDMIIFGEYIDFSNLHPKNEFVVSWIIGHGMYDCHKTIEENEAAFKYIKHASAVANLKSAHFFLMYKIKNKEERMIYAERYFLLYSKDDLVLKNDLIFEVATYLLEKGEKDRALKIAELSLYPEDNWIINDTIYHFINYAKKFLCYAYNEPYFLQKFEEKLSELDTSSFVYKNGCNAIARCFSKNKNYEKAIEYYTKTKNYYRLTKIYMKLDNDIETQKYFELALENEQYNVYYLKIDNNNFLEYSKLLYKNFCKFGEEIFYNVIDNYNDKNDINYSEILSFLHSVVKKYEDRNHTQFWNYKKNDLFPEDISVLFYSIGFIYRNVIKDEVQYKKYMNYGNKWYPLHEKYESDYGNSLGYAFYDDPEYEPNQKRYTLWNNTN